MLDFMSTVRTLQACIFPLVSITGGRLQCTGPPILDAPHRRALAGVEEASPKIQRLKLAA
jgi:hypothetical protein